MADVPKWVAGYIGIPFKTGGTTREGCDCVGLVRMVWRERFGRDLPDYDGAHWSAEIEASSLREAAERYSRLFRRIEAGEERLGDGILIRMRGHPLHLAMVVTPGWMLHVETETDSCLTEYRTSAWRNRLLGFYRFD